MKQSQRKLILFFCLSIVKSDLYIKGREKKIVFLFSKVIIDSVQTGLYILVWDDNLKKCQTLS